MHHRLRPLFALALCIPMLAALTGCEADADVTTDIPDGVAPVDPDDGSDDPGGGNDDTGFPNAGEAGGAIFEDTTQIVGGDSGMNFACSDSASGPEGVTVEAAAFGLVGGAVVDLVDLLEGDSLSDLLAAVGDLPYVADNTMRTASVFTLTLSLLGDTVSTLGERVHMPIPIEANGENYAVFAISFPESLLSLALFNSVEVTTFLDGVQQEEPVSISAVNLDLLGFSLGTEKYAYVGRRVTQPYDQVEIRMNAPLLSLDLGDALFIHEMCVKGTLIPVDG